MTADIYNKLQKIYDNNFLDYQELNKKEKGIYNHVWNEIINSFIDIQNKEYYVSNYKDSFSFSSELNLLFIKDGFNIKIIKDNKENYNYELSIKNESIINIMSNDNEVPLIKSLQK